MTVISPRTEEPFRQLFRDTLISAGRQSPSMSTRKLGAGSCAECAADKKAGEAQQSRQRCKLRCKFARRTGPKGSERGSMRGRRINEMEGNGPFRNWRAAQIVYG